MLSLKVQGTRFQRTSLVRCVIPRLFKQRCLFTFQAYALYREFVVGTNQTGLVVTDGTTTSVVGGIHTEYEPGILTASGVLTGSYRTEGTYTWPAESWAAWGSYIATRTATDVPPAIETSNTQTGSGSADIINVNGEGDTSQPVPVAADAPVASETGQVDTTQPQPGDTVPNSALRMQSWHLGATVTAIVAVTWILQ